jgi:uncharacterized Zn finger protein (UPF0148 family)
MATTTIEEQNCRACGVDIREGALFCYNCGGSVTYDDAPAESSEAISEAWFREEIAEEAADETSAEEEIAEEKNVDDAETKNLVRPKGRLRESPRLRSAAALRRKAKNIRRKKFETVVWEEHENPSGRFVVVAVLLTLLSALIFWLAIYLK